VQPPLVLKLKKSRVDNIVWLEPMEMALLGAIQKEKVLIKTPKMSQGSKWTNVTNSLRRNDLFRGYRDDVISADKVQQKFKNLKNAAKKGWSTYKTGANTSGLEITPLATMLYSILLQEETAKNVTAASEARKDSKDEEMKYDDY
jgi:hypothetical protein